LRQLPLSRAHRVVLNWPLARLIPSHGRIELENGFSRSLVLPLALTVSISAAAAARRAPTAPLPYVPIQQIVLANGLKAVLVKRRQAPVVTLEVWYHVGSKNEAPGMAGFAHLFEHLMFGGTKDLGRDQFSRYIVGAGGVDNAYTTVDATVFWETIPSSILPLELWLEADRDRNALPERLHRQPLPAPAHRQHERPETSQAERRPGFL
jgi:hypothetical protein